MRKSCKKLRKMWKIHISHTVMDKLISHCIFSRFSITNRFSHNSCSESNFQIHVHAFHLTILPITLNVKLSQLVQVPLLVTVQFTVCAPTPKLSPETDTSLPSESVQVIVWFSMFVAVTWVHSTSTDDSPGGAHRSSTEGTRISGEAVRKVKVNSQHWK